MSAFGSTFIPRNLDRALFARMAAARPRGVQSVLPRLSRAADHGVLWAGAAAALGVFGGRSARRAALRGLGSLAIASTVSNLVAKPTTRRTRPVIDQVPVARRLSRTPHTTSFPSGHSASAAAFTFGVALESPRAALLIAPLAGAVALSRIYVGVHYPSDVLAGVAIGAAAAALTSHWWPTRPEAPATAVQPRLPAPELADGAGLSLVVNPGSGLTGQVDDSLRDLLPQADIRTLKPEDDLVGLLDEAAEHAARAGGALGVCGGDGTVNAAAGAAVRHGVPLAVFPGGTFNHFAADLGIETMEQVAQAVRAGDAVRVDLGRVASADGAREKIFLNTFSLGVYPELVHLRERLGKWIGKWPALAVSLAAVLATSRPTTVTINGVERRLWLLFAGNGVYHPAGFTPSYRPSLDDGLLDIRTVDGSLPLARTRLLLAVLTGTLHNSRVLVTGQVSRLRLETAERQVLFAYDGEVTELTSGSLVLGKRRQAVTVYRPAGPVDGVSSL
ncbi:phosphatase PAP2 family protein [Streptomyces xiamenensis]